MNWTALKVVSPTASEIITVWIQWNMLMIITHLHLDLGIFGLPRVTFRSHIEKEPTFQMMMMIIIMIIVSSSTRGGYFKLTFGRTTGRGLNWIKSLAQRYLWRICICWAIIVQLNKNYTTSFPPLLLEFHLKLIKNSQIWCSSSSLWIHSSTHSCVLNEFKQSTEIIMA